MAKHRQGEEILKLIEKEKRRGFRKKERGIVNEKGRERERVKLSKRENVNEYERKRERWGLCS